MGSGIYIFHELHNISFIHMVDKRRFESKKNFLVRKVDFSVAGCCWRNHFRVEKQNKMMKAQRDFECSIPFLNLQLQQVSTQQWSFPTCLFMFGCLGKSNSGAKKLPPASVSTTDKCVLRMRWIFDEKSSLHSEGMSDVKNNKWTKFLFTVAFETVVEASPHPQSDSEWW